MDEPDLKKHKRSFQRIAVKLGEAIVGESRVDVIMTLASFARACCTKWGVPPDAFVDAFYSASGESDEGPS